MESKRWHQETDDGTGILSPTHLFLTHQQHGDTNFDQRSRDNVTDRSRSLSPAPHGHQSGTSPGNTSPMKLQPVSTHTSNTQSLAPPPPAPHGPRLPSPNQPRSRTPSPQRSIGDITTRSGYLGSGRKSSEKGDDSDGHDIIAPIGLSEKALGKRRVVEEDDRMHPSLRLYPTDV